MEDLENLSVAGIRAVLAQASVSDLSQLCAQFQDDSRAGVQAARSSALARVAAAERERLRTERLYETERALHSRGCVRIAGVDEVGRGALAGPLTVAAVVLPQEPLIEGLDDSKRLSPARRVELAVQIRATAVAYSIAHIEAHEIDSTGISASLKRAVLLALGGLNFEVDHLLVDGLPLRVFHAETAIVKGDSKVAAIAAASILAKVTRDELMRELDADYPAYGFALNKGYGSPEHITAVSRHGLSAIHRRSFSMGGGTPSLF